MAFHVNCTEYAVYYRKNHRVRKNSVNTLAHDCESEIVRFEGILLFIVHFLVILHNTVSNYQLFQIRE